MKKNILCCALLAAAAMAQSATAQDFDDRWYLTGGVGMNFQDRDRETNDDPFVTLGFGKFITPNWSIDGELNYQNPRFDDLNCCSASTARPSTPVTTSSRKAATGGRTSAPASARSVSRKNSMPSRTRTRRASAKTPT